MTIVANPPPPDIYHTNTFMKKWFMEFMLALWNYKSYAIK